MRKQFTTTIEESIQNKFRDTCSSNEVSMNVVLEALMDAYIKGQLQIEKQIKYSVSNLNQ